MKKFYERPVVEIAVFDVEDIITTSAEGGSTNTYQDEAAANTLLNAIQGEDSSTTNRNFAGAGKYNAYKW